MPNTLATPTWVTREVTRRFENNCKFVANLNRSYSDQYVQGGAKVGNTVQARLPQRFVASHGQALVLQSLYDRTVPITLNDQVNIGFGYSSAQATTELQDIRERYTNPAGDTLANECDKSAFQNLYSSIYNAIGGTTGTPIPGTTPSANLAYLMGGVKLTDGAAAVEGRKAVLDTLAQAIIVNANLSMFNPAAAISEQYKTGMFGRGALGFGEWFYDQNTPIHTTGTFTASTPLVNGASQTGSTININGWASGATTLKKGDVFTIAGVYGWNPLSQKSTGRLQQFVVTADTSDSTGTTATLPISPSIITSGSLQTVSGSPANGAAVTVWNANPAAGTLATTVSPQGMLFLPDFAAWVSADLEMPEGGADGARVQSKQFGVSIRLVRQYQIGTDQNPSRLDILKGEAVIRPEFACRVVG